MTDHREMARVELARLLRNKYLANGGPPEDYDDGLGAWPDAWLGLADEVRALLDRAAELEREACAKVADAVSNEANRKRNDYESRFRFDHAERYEMAEDAADSIAAAIRARGGSK